MRLAPALLLSAHISAPPPPTSMSGRGRQQTHRLISNICGDSGSTPRSVTTWEASAPNQIGMFAQEIKLLKGQRLGTLIVFSEPNFLTASQDGSVMPTMDRGPEVQCCSTDLKVRKYNVPKCTTNYSKVAMPAHSTEAQSKP